MSARPPSGWQGPLRAAAAVFVVGVLVVWLVKPIGNPCPDLERLPQGSTASSSPSFSPPGSRTCTYTAAGGTQAMSTYVPWLDWIVLLLLAAVVAGVVRALSPAGRVAGEGRPREASRRAGREPPAGREPRAGREPPATRTRAARPPRAEPHPRAARPPRDEPPPPAPPPAPSPEGSSERDAAERERARQERAARRRR